MQLLRLFGVVVIALVVPRILGTASAADMPAIVEKFEETKDLWNKLHDSHYVSGTYSTPIDGPSPPWQSFLKTYGHDVAQEDLRQPETMPMFKNIYRLVHYPMRYSKITIHGEGGPRIVMSRLITRYAEHLDKHPHLVDVYWHMSRPSNAASLLVSPPAEHVEDNFFVSD
ncbi:hypothetical protein PSEUBRA_005342 [Kalmanozyma brasiliensis GHG001]|uniref:uncharacterized protein n=1 Tax=Kalmanozyma brasiliensis (strain GHG001) TaxID=1365824 RepID=UPI0028680FC7|nr:uncharacterized protein PSEUBRA_005342 [Kalmanozyma brasiliensis GHG001]KAF6767512.1 hypothetical protein PSEUBRA_005342 [Kalmanozyma brasiliensis GHG001]